MAKVTRKVEPAAKRLDLALKALDSVVGKVGWFDTAHYPDGTPVAYVASIHEFGYPEGNIPPRLGMRETAKEREPAWKIVARQCAKAVLAGTMTAKQAMEAIGLKAAGDIRKHISKVTQPPLKVDTVKARLVGKKQGRVVSLTVAKPLVDTGELLGSVSNRVDVKGAK